jgi:hypothetical protein
MRTESLFLFSLCHDCHPVRKHERKKKYSAGEDKNWASWTWENWGQISLFKVSMETTLPLMVRRKRLFHFYRAPYFTNTEHGSLGHMIECK